MTHLKNYLPGMRIIKTVLAVLACLVVGYILNYPKPFYACIAAVLVMQSSPQKSVEKGKHRIIGTLWGGFMGALFTALSFVLKIPTDSFLYLVGIALTVLVGLSFAKIMHFTDYATSMCCVLILSSIMNHGDTLQVLLVYFVSRIIETIIGIIIAVLINTHVNTSYSFNESK